MALLSIILPILPVIYEDFRYRAINWIWIAILTLLILFIQPLNWSYIATNIFFVTLKIILLSIYFSLKHKRQINIFRYYLGIGDLVFFLPLCLLFSPINLIAFFIFSLLLSLSGFTLFNSISKNKSETVPLAGCMAISLCLVLSISIFFEFNLYDDSWYLNFLIILHKNMI